MTPSNAYHLDYETFSVTPIKLGEHRYAENAEIMLTAACRNDEEILLWDAFAPPSENEPFIGLLEEMDEDDQAPVYAHNAYFESAITRNCFKKTFKMAPIALHRWRCTQAMCRRMAIPESLEKAAEFLQLDVQKDKVGKALIRIFTMPQTVGKLKGHRILPTDDLTVTVAGTRMHVRDAWLLFREYCRQDIATERALHKKIKAVEFTGATLEAFQFDMAMNHFGIPIDVPALKKAHAMVEDYKTALVAESIELGGLAPSQTKALLPWLRERGYKGDDLRANTLDVAIEEDEEDDPAVYTSWSADADPAAKRVLHIRRLVSSAAVKKLPTMVKAVCSDGRLRGQLKFWGAQRTGRWSGRGSQPQNFKRPTFKEHETAFYDFIAGRSADYLELCYGDLLDVISSMVRHFIRLDGVQFLDSDYRQIEARVLAWVATSKPLLAAFAQGKDLYTTMAALMFNVAYDEVTKDQRFMGKVATLACGYYGGVNAFMTMAKTYRLSITEKEAERIVALYRKANPEIVNLWKKVGTAAIAAVENPGQTFQIETCNVSFVVRRLAGYDNLLLTLPSGRKLVYPKPKIEKVAKKFKNKQTGEWDTWEVKQIYYWGQRNNIWTWVETHGGTLVENICQAVAGDFLTEGCVAASKQGYNIFMVVHDQALAQFNPATDSAEAFTSILCTKPAWAQDFPLEAATNIVDFYTKD